MGKSIVAIVGRPNVGKSTLFNRLCRKRSAIVDFEEGITRDRKYEEVEWDNKVFVIVDTGGIIPDSTQSIDKAIRYQAEIAIEEADLILFLVDVKTGITDHDMQIARILSPHREKVLLVVNKVDNEKDELDMYDFLRLGFGEPFGIAASSGRNTGNFLQEIVNSINADEIVEVLGEPDDIKVAIVGRPNVGKSSIVNKLMGQESVIVSDVPGTTRDSIDLKLNYFQKSIILIDTAGLRKKKKVKYGVEYFSSMRTIESIDRSDIVILMLDSTADFSDQDQHIASYAHRKNKSLIILINKWDLVDKDNKTHKEFLLKVGDQFPFIEFAPILTISALTGQRVQKVLEAIIQVDEESKRRIPTSQVNQFVEKVINERPPSNSKGTHIRIYYATQSEIKPPTFVFFCNYPKYINENYRRFLYNKIREEFGFKGSAVKLIFKGKNNDVDTDN